MKITIAVARAVAIPLAFTLAACASSGKAGSSTTSSSTKATASTASSTSKAPTTKATSASVSHDLGAKDASADVVLGKVTVDPTLGLPTVPVTVTNHSSKRSNYIIEVALETADGKTQLASGFVSVDNLEPGQTSNQTASFFEAMNKGPLPAGAKPVLKSVDRLAS
jgi:Flp pilus assembly protein TadD